MHLVDYHVHSHHSCDGQSTIVEMCQGAIERGIVEIGFAEHMDFEPKDWGYGFFNYETYTAEIHRAREMFRNQLIIRKGVEIDYQHCFEDEVRTWLQGKNFDYTIGSVHYIDHELITQLLTQRRLDGLLEKYIDEVLYSIKSGMFDVIGHLTIDYILSHRPREDDDRDFMSATQNVLQEIRDHQLYLEVNTKWLRESYHETVPSRRLIREYVLQGGDRFSVGSDAHSVKNVGHGISDVLEFVTTLEELTLLFDST